MEPEFITIGGRDVELNPPVETLDPQKKYVIYVDDEVRQGGGPHFIIGMLGSWLESEGALLRVYTEPEKVIELLTHNESGLQLMVLSDNNMPGMSGRDMFLALKVAGKLPERNLMYSSLPNLIDPVQGVKVFDKAGNPLKEVLEIVRTMKAPSAPGSTHPGQAPKDLKQA